MRILALNCGSSSVKAALIAAPSWRRALDVRAQEIGKPGATLCVDDTARTLEQHLDLEGALELVFEQARKAPSRTALAAIAHRVVHGGNRFTAPTRLDGDSIAELERLSPLAPLHNPPSLTAIKAAMRAFPGVPHVAVFDTAFHTTLPSRARHYALPVELAVKHGFRRFGFHGLSHSHVVSAVTQALQASAQELRIISCHLGNGASVTAIEYGRSVETSMGVTPLEGLIMGTRAGDLDPGILLELLDNGYDATRLRTLLNQQSGLAGLTGTNDMRQIEERAASGDEACRLALTLYAHRVRKYIGAYAAVMGGVDAIAFTGGVGENSALVRHRCLQRLDFLGAALDEDRNRDIKRGSASAIEDISAEHSRTRLFVVKADEELALARETFALLSATAPPPKSMRIPVAVSARHVHLRQATVERLFGPGHQLQVRAPLSQTGQFASEETVTLVGPRGRIAGVRVLGPPRSRDQVEISRTDEFVLGIDAPVRISGDLDNTPGITLEGTHGSVTLKSGVITARRHIHMSVADAERFGVKDHDTVEVRIDSNGRDLTFGDVSVRISPDFKLEMHLDTDEANAAGIERGDQGELIAHTEVTGAIRKR